MNSSANMQKRSQGQRPKNQNPQKPPSGYNNDGANANRMRKSDRSRAKLERGGYLKYLQPKGPGIQTSVAAAYATGQGTQAPLIQASRDQARIVHRELIASVTGSSSFAVPLSFSLNPGLAATFPWLSSQAQAWETYKFNRLRFCYYTRTGSNVPGSVMLVPDYDAADAAPSSEQIASSYEDVAEDAPWKDICHELRPSSMFSMGPRKFIRTGPVPAGTDIKTYDAGQEFVCTTDGTAVNWGKLWVEYDVTLFTPQLPSGGSLFNAGASVASGGGSVSNAAIFGAVPVVVGDNVAVTAAANTVTFQTPGTYLAVLDGVGTLSNIIVTTGTAAATLSLQGCVGDTANFYIAAKVVVSAPGQTLIFSSPTGTVTAAGLQILPLAIPSVL